MENDISVAFLPDNIQQCFLELFNEAIKLRGKNYYNDALYTISNYLSNNISNNTFDYVIEKHPGVNKYNLRQMAFAKSLELNYYRLKKDIDIDIRRALLLKNLCDSFVESVVNGSDTIVTRPSDNIYILNDAYLYLSHPSTYRYNSVKTFKEDGFDEIVASLYGFTKFDHIKQLSQELPRKEVLFENLIEETIHSIERKQFDNNTPPVFNYAYYKNCKNTLNDNKIIYQDIVDNFNKNNNLDDNDIISMMEMITSILNYKEDVVLPSGNKMPFYDDEKHLLEEINMASDDKEKIINLYKIRRSLILKIIVSCIFDISKEDILKYSFEFNNNKKID